MLYVHLATCHKLLLYFMHYIGFFAFHFNHICIFDIPSWPAGVSLVKSQLEMATTIRFGTTSSPCTTAAAERAQLAEEMGKLKLFFLIFNNKSYYGQNVFICCSLILKMEKGTVTLTNFCSAPLTRTTRSGPAASLTILLSAGRWVECPFIVTYTRSYGKILWN